MERLENALKEVAKLALTNRNTLDIIFEKQAEILSKLNATDKGIELLNMNNRLEELETSNQIIIDMMFGN